LGRRSRRKQRPGPGDQRSEQRPAHADQRPQRSDQRPQRSEQRRARSEQRNAQVRAALEPLAPGERPVPVVIAALLATALGLANLVLYAAGVKIRDKAPGPGVLTFSAVMAVAAVGMWQLRYWALLGFQALLALIVIVFCLLLVRAANLEAVGVSVAVIGLGGWLFFKLVRALARIQMPTRRPSG
jgi:hypothetical protein